MQGSKKGVPIALEWEAMHVEQMLDSFGEVALLNIVGQANTLGGVVLTISNHGHTKQPSLPMLWQVQLASLVPEATQNTFKIAPVMWHGWRKWRVPKQVGCPVV